MDRSGAWWNHSDQTPCHAFQITHDFHYECTWVEMGLSHPMLGGMLSGLGQCFVVVMAIVSIAINMLYA